MQVCIEGLFSGSECNMLLPGAILLLLLLLHLGIPELGTPYSALHRIVCFFSKAAWGVRIAHRAKSKGYSAVAA